MDIKKIIILTIDSEESDLSYKNCVDTIKASDLADIPIERFYGINGKEERVPNSLTSGRWNGDLSNLKGSKAVCYSHLNIIMGSVGCCPKEGDMVLVLECDVEVHPQIKHYLSQIDIPNDSDFTHLSYWDNNVGTENQLKHGHYLSKIINNGCTGFYSYLVRPRKVYERLVNALPFTCEVDNFLSSPSMRRVFNIYVVEHTPQLTTETSKISTRRECDDISWLVAQTKPRKIISYCLYGSDPIYRVGMKENLKLAKIFYPEWEVFVYCDTPTYEEVYVELSNLGAKVFNAEETQAMYSRLLPLNTNQDAIRIFRDADSRFSYKELSAVDEWLESDKTLHIMKDHEFHGHTKIMGGMFGLKPHPVKLDLNRPDFNYGDDEALLTEVLFPMFQDDYIQHDNGRFGGIVYPSDDLTQKGEFVGKKVPVE